MAASVCHSLSRSALPLAAARSLCTGITETRFKVPNPSTASQLQLTLQPEPSFLPLPPSKAGSLVGVRRYASGFLSRGASPAGRAAAARAAGASDWASTFGLDSLFSKSSDQSPNQILLENIVPGPPSEVVPFVFAEVSDLRNERFYPPYFLELLASWQAHEKEFEGVFWKTLKQQATGTLQLKLFLGFFLTDRKTAVGGFTGSKLGRRLEGVFLEEGRCNPVTHQLDGLYEVFERMAYHEYMKHDSQRFRKLCARFEAARDGNAAAALRERARFPREQPPWRATSAPGREVRTVALLAEAPPGENSEDPSARNTSPENASDEGSEEEVPGTDTGIPTDGLDQLGVTSNPLAVTREVPRDEVEPTHVGHPEDVVPFVFGEASDLENEKHYRPLIKELLLSWYAFTESFEDVFWRILKQQTTGTYKLRGFLAFFLTDRGVCVGKLTGADLRERLTPRFLEEARFGSVTHQLDGLDDILERLPGASLSASKVNGLKDKYEKHEELSALKDHFRSIRSKNAAEIQVLEERFPREIPSWRLPISQAETTSAKIGE